MQLDQQALHSTASIVTHSAASILAHYFSSSTSISLNRSHISYSSDLSVALSNSPCIRSCTSLFSPNTVTSLIRGPHRSSFSGHHRPSQQSPQQILKRFIQKSLQKAFSRPMTASLCSSSNSNLIQLS